MITISHIYIKNFKSIKELTIPFQCYGSGKDASNTIFLVGINESGKSAILEAISFLEKGLKDISYDFYSNSEALKDNKDIIVSATLKLDNKDFWKKQIVEKLKLPTGFGDNIEFKNLEKYVYRNVNKSGEKFRITINEDFPFYQYIVNKTKKTITNTMGTQEQSEVIETIENLSVFNKVEEKITEDNAKTFLKDNQTLLTKEILEDKISLLCNSIINQHMPQIQIWKPDPKYLINETIDLNKFKEDPNISIPLKNIFSIYGKNTNNEIKTTIEKSLSNQARCDELKDQLGDSVTKYINKIWKEHKITIKISINSANCAVHVEDNDKKYTYYSMLQRSDGFKQFISLILSLSAKNESNNLKNNIILIDEPEIHLHPSGIEYMRDEILKIGKNNHVIVATHSYNMVDRNLRERHWIVQKEKAETKISQMNENFNFTDDKVLAKAFGLNLLKTLLPQNIVIVEGIDDKNIISHAFHLLNKTFFCSIKDAGGASKIPGFARLLNEENIKPFIILDADKEGAGAKKKILDEQKDFYSESNVFTLKDILPSLPDNSTIEDLLPIDFVKIFFNNEMEMEFELVDNQPIIFQLKNQSQKLKEDKQKMDSLKIKLSNKFCSDFKTERKIEDGAARLKEFVKLICATIKENNAE